MNKQVRKPKILIVDDVPANIRMLIEILKDEYATITATNGEVALQKIQTPPLPDLILLDILLPGMDGYEVCKKMKENEITKDIPVIFVSALSEAMDDAKAFSVGGVDYVTKPYNPPTVKARVTNQINLRTVTLELQKVFDELKEALSKIKTLSDLLPICTNCKNIRDDKDYWNQVEEYIKKHSEAESTHSICPDCKIKLPQFRT